MCDDFTISRVKVWRESEKPEKKLESCLQKSFTYKYKSGAGREKILFGWSSYLEDSTDSAGLDSANYTGFDSKSTNVGHLFKK